MLMKVEVNEEKPVKERLIKLTVRTKLQQQGIPQPLQRIDENVQATRMDG